MAVSATHLDTVLLSSASGFFLTMQSATDVRKSTGRLDTLLAFSSASWKDGIARQINWTQTLPRNCFSSAPRSQLATLLTKLCSCAADKQCFTSFQNVNASWRVSTFASRLLTASSWGSPQSGLTRVYLSFSLKADKLCWMDVEIRTDRLLLESSVQHANGSVRSFTKRVVVFPNTAWSSLPAMSHFHLHHPHDIGGKLHRQLLLDLLSKMFRNCERRGRRRELASWTRCDARFPVVMFSSPCICRRIDRAAEHIKYHLKPGCLETSLNGARAARSNSNDISLELAPIIEVQAVTSVHRAPHTPSRARCRSFSLSLAFLRLCFFWFFFLA